MKRFTFIFILSIVAFFASFFVYADELEDLSRELEKTVQDLESSKKATETNEKELETISKKLENIKARVNGLEREIVRKEKQIEEGEEKIAEQKLLLDERVVSYYKNTGKVTDSFFQIFLSENLSTSLNEFFYQKSMIDEDRRAILRVAMQVQEIEEKKVSLQKEKDQLEPLRAQVDKQLAFLGEEVAKAKKYQKELENKIIELNEKQKAIIAARSGSNITSVGNVPDAGDPASSISYKSSAPGNSFAVFSFGGYTHRNGMSQYGAKARAEAGQNAEAILQAYFPGSTVNKEAAIPDTIEVEGHGTIPFKDYLLGIYEVPESWPIEVLKAQAVLARTYAMRAGKPICTTERCQVYKPAPKSGAWKQAVEETERWVLENTPNAQYSSTTGGYTNNAGWDTTDGSGSGDWSSKAYESIARSPWFYKSWFRNGYRNDSDSCGRPHPWLSQAEFSDIINAWIVSKNPQGADTSRILPITINSCAVGSKSGNPYSMDELRELANKSGGAVTSISAIRTENNNSGQTTAVVMQTNKGEIRISGNEFRDIFNLRAPGFIHIPQFNYVFINVEKT